MHILRWFLVCKWCYWQIISIITHCVKSIGRCTLSICGIQSKEEIERQIFVAWNASFFCFISPACCSRQQRLNDAINYLGIILVLFCIKSVASTFICASARTCTHTCTVLYSFRGQPTYSLITFRSRSGSIFLTLNFYNGSLFWCHPCTMVKTNCRFILEPRDSNMEVLSMKKL